MPAPELKSIKSVVIPTDFESVSATAFAHALALSLVLKADLSIVHIDDDRGHQSAWHRFPAVRDTLTRWNLLEAGVEALQVFERLGIKIRKVVGRGKDPVKAMAAFLEKNPTSLLVVGTEARGGLAKLVEPSVASAIARSTGTMTLFVPASTDGFVNKTDGAINMRRIVVPVDSEPDPTRA